ncbi:hypothetical protein [Stenotrophomonas sp.]|uniref:hypothetical protein n=1 Tax=Stenotrophomonas sp. TaxID=69392 RepID=UPI00289A6179|nr:hypothetical protein [Stenotrophomonas sp.]
MSDTTTYAEQVRAALAKAPADGCSYAELYELLAAAGMPAKENRDRVISILRYLVARNYVARVGVAGTARFSLTGKAMEKPRLNEAQQAERRREKGRRRAARRKVRLEHFRSEPVAALGARAPLIPKPARKAAGPSVLGETVAEFVARGGRVQRLSASWEQTDPQRRVEVTAVVADYRRILRGG